MANRYLYFYKVQVGGTQVYEDFYELEFFETEEEYVPTGKLAKEEEITHKFKKQFENVPGRNYVFYYNFTTNYNEVENIKRKLKEFIDEDYKKQIEQLEKEIYFSNKIIENLWANKDVY